MDFQTDILDKFPPISSVFSPGVVSGMLLVVSIIALSRALAVFVEEISGNITQRRINGFPLIALSSTVAAPGWLLLFFGYMVGVVVFMAESELLRSKLEPASVALNHVLSSLFLQVLPSMPSFRDVVNFTLSAHLAQELLHAFFVTGPIKRASKKRAFKQLDKIHKASTGEDVAKLGSPAAQGSRNRRSKP